MWKGIGYCLCVSLHTIFVLALLYFDSIPDSLLSRNTHVRRLTLRVYYLHRGTCRGDVSGFVKSCLGCLHRGVMPEIFRARVNSNNHYPFHVRRLQHRLHSVVCCVFSSHSFSTSISLDVPAGVTQQEGHTGFLIHLLSAVRALIFLARRIQPFLSLVDREVGFCVLMI